MWNFLFFFNGAALGVGLAMDAFSASLANGLAEPDMSKPKGFSIAGVFAFFQFLMPMIGWACVSYAAEKFAAIQKFVPYVALALLLFIGGKMLVEGIKKKGEDEKGEKLSFVQLIIQGIATSIDALSVGFTIAEYEAIQALVCSLVIAATTFVICSIGVAVGKKFGTKLAGTATCFGGTILIIIGIEIFVKGVLL